MGHVTHTIGGHAAHGGHLLHVVLISLAAVIFAIYVAIDAYRYGFPTFSWRLGEGVPDAASDQRMRG